jgi:flagella basal body P-ring formation protein FlgA
MTKLLLFITLSLTASANCIPATGSRIQASDLAQADPQFKSLPSTLIAGFNAEPGATRIFTAAELQRLAKANGVQIQNPTDLCFEIPLQHLSAEDVTTAMQRVLPHEATLKILQIQSATVPAGKPEFPLNTLEPDGTWRGYIKYAETKKAPVWARVSVTANYTVVTATTELPADTAIPAASLRLDQKTGPLQHEQAAATIAEVAGRAPKRAIKAGTQIPVSLLTEAPAVHRGDSIRVEVRSGPARVHFEAVAETSASLGSFVELRNPANGKTFKGRLESPSMATIDLGSLAK